MDDEEDDDIGGYIESESENLEDEDDLETEEAKKAWESEELEEDIIEPTQLSNINEQIDLLNAQIENGEISLDKYNELLIYNQMRLSDEKYKLMNFAKNDKISKDLITELDSLFTDLKKTNNRDKLDPLLIQNTMDDIFRQYGRALENELTEESEFFFESNFITSDIGNIINLPVPDKYQKQLQIFELKITKNDIGIEDLYTYLDLRFNILNDNLEENLKHDVFYLRFHMELQLEFASLRSELELLVGNTGIVIDEDLDKFNQKHNIKTGVFKSRKEFLTILRSALDNKLDILIKKYTSVQDILFKKHDSKEVLKIIKQLREIYIKNEYLKLERRFTDDEIIDDFKNKPLGYIIEKYSQYIVSEYFDWAAGEKKEEIFERPIFNKKFKLSDKEYSLIKQHEQREHAQRKEFETIISTLPKEILLKCADRLIAEGKLSEPYSLYTAQEKYINELYRKTIPIWIFSKYYSNDINAYAKEVNKMTDEFMIDKYVLKANWDLGPKVEVGNIVYIDRTNGNIRKTISQIEKIQNQINNFNMDIAKTMGRYKVDIHLNKLKHHLNQLELKLNSYNKYIRTPQLKGIAVKIDTEKQIIDVKVDGSSTITSFPDIFVTSYLKPKKEIPLYVIADSDAFNPSAPLKETSIYPISQWIRIVLGNEYLEYFNEELKMYNIQGNMSANELMLTNYNNALEKYKSLSAIDKEKVDIMVIKKMPQKYIKQFVNGIPSKEPLMFIYPPKIPEIPEKESTEINFEEFIDYSIKLKEYTDNLSPEINPYVKIGVPVTNKLISKINDRTYSSLKEAIKHTPINGFFKLSSIDDFMDLVLNFMSMEDKKSLQKLVLSNEQIKDYTELFYLGMETNTDRLKQESMQYKPISNPKVTLVFNLKNIIDQDEYIDTVFKIDKEIKIQKIVGEEVFVEGRSKPITKINLEKMLTSSLERDAQTKTSISVSKKKDPILGSIEWGFSFNPTFQLLDLSKRFRDSFIVHTEPTKYRIRIAHHSGRFHSGWTVNPLKEVVNRKFTYTYQFPLIVTDFTEYLKLHRNSLVIRYENFRKLDILSYEEFTSSSYIIRHINYISQYFKDIGIEDSFDIKIITQQDAHFKIRQEQIHEISEALKFMYGSIIDQTTLQNIANDIESEVYKLFQDIRAGIGKKLENVLTSEQSEHFELMKKFRKSGLSSTYTSKILYNIGNRGMYTSYLYRISIAIFNIYRTNNFIQNFIGGTISLKSLIDRDLTKEEIIEGPDTIENLVSWLPSTEILNTMRKAHPDAYERIIKNGPNIIDISVLTNYERDIGQSMTFLNKKLALIELVKLKSWQQTLSMLGTIKESKQLMYLIKHRNALRSVNNITAGIRLNTFNNIRIQIEKCGIQQNQNIIEEYAENIELACYSLSNNLNEYKQISESILSEKAKLCKLISDFISSGIGPIDIITNFAELFLDFEKTIINNLYKAKLGDWNGIKNLPNELLLAIKKVSNGMVQSEDRIKKGNKVIKQNPNLESSEFKVITSFSGGSWSWGWGNDKIAKNNKIISKIDKPLIVDEKKGTLNMFLNIIKYNYVPRVNDTFSQEIQKVIDTNNLTEQIVDELNSRENITSKDIEKLKSLNYNQLLDINANVYREPIFVDVIPLSFANSGIKVYPIKSRGGFLIGGNFPLDAKAYRYRNADNKINTRLTEICDWIGIGIGIGIGISQNDVSVMTYPPDMSVYSNEITTFEKSMLSCVEKLLKLSIWIKIRGEDIANSKEVLSKIITEFGMHSAIEQSVIKYFNLYGGDKKLFANGGTKEEYNSFLNKTLYTEAMQKLLGVDSLSVKKENYKTPIVDNNIEVSILKNGNHEIYRKLYKSKTETYPVPIGYSPNNYPIYSKNQKTKLAFLIEAGYISPWYKNKIIITKKNNIQFEGDLPFIIDETSDSWTESNYYVEQTFRDPMYGLPIITRIGIIPKRIEGKEGYNIIKKIKIPENKFIIKEEPFKIKYFKFEIPTQSQVNEFRLSEAQMPLSLTKKELAKKSGYSIIDSRMLTYSVKYDPDDVWSWDPLKDYKVGAQEDNSIWIAEKNKQLAILKDWLKKAGSSSSAFIALKNDSTRYLQMVRINLPSQKRNELTQTRFKKPKKSIIELNLLKINKIWKKYSKEELINEAKRINFYTPDMTKLKVNEIFTKMKLKLEDEVKITPSIIDTIGIISDDEIKEYNKGFKKIEDGYFNHTRYIDNFLKNEFIIISPEVMKVIENPKILFHNYNRYDIRFDESGNVNFSPKYGNEGPFSEETALETIYEIIKNMSYTTNFGFNKHIIDYINDLSLFEKLSNENKMKIIVNFPIMKIIIKLKQKGLKITIWNILTISYDMWYPVFYKGMKPEQIADIKKRTLKYSFETPLEITLEDVINYLGDSYYQNARYAKGIEYEQISNKYTGGILYLKPGYKYDKINVDEVAFIDKTSMSTKYVHNPYITLFRNLNDKDPKISIEILIAGDELHNNKLAVTTNFARRAAFLYGVDLSNVNPCFRLPDPNISGRFSEVAINEKDIIKYLEKGGNYYTILEMTDEELKFRKLPLDDKLLTIKYYRGAVKEYFKSKDRPKTYKDLIQKKHLNPLTLNIYIENVSSANIKSGQLSHYIDTLNILPDFLDLNWPHRKQFLEKQFLEKASISIDNFLNGTKRDIYLNIEKPSKRLYQ